LINHFLNFNQARRQNVILRPVSAVKRLRLLIRIKLRLRLLIRIKIIRKYAISTRSFRSLLKVEPNGNECEIKNIHNHIIHCICKHYIVYVKFVYIVYIKKYSMAFRKVEVTLKFPKCLHLEKLLLAYVTSTNPLDAL